MKPFQRKPGGKWVFDDHDVHGVRRFGSEADKRTALSVQAKRETEWRMVKAAILTPEQVLEGRIVGKPTAERSVKETPRRGRASDANVGHRLTFKIAAMVNAYRVGHPEITKDEIRVALLAVCESMSALSE